MGNQESVLTPSEARAFYDEFGKKQDAQGFYENPALDDLVTHARFQDAQKVFEFGCGTGKFAARLLAGHLPSSAIYFGCDVSQTMIELATQRLAGYGERAKVARSDGTVHFALPGHSVDHVIATYVLDLLSEDDIRQLFAEAHRVIHPGGRLCLVSLTKGVTLPSRIVSGLWTRLFRMRASLVGGCRPIRLGPYVHEDLWKSEYRKVLTPFGVPSEVLVLVQRSRPTISSTRGQDNRAL